MTWPANLLDASYGTSVLNAVTQKEYELTWTPITASSSDHEVKFLFSERPLRIDGVFVNVSATTQQQCADALGALLPTPKMMDLAWLQRAATISPAILPIASTSAAMIQASSQLDARISAAGAPSGAIVCQKTWALGNSLLAHSGRAMNYGFFVIPNQGTAYSGIATEACVSITDPKKGRVIQGQGWAHDPSHIDYSQCAWFVHRSCQVDGVDADLADVLRDKTLAPLVSHEGPITVPGLRQPGVPVFSCALPSTPTKAFVPLVAPSDMCPMPARPANVVVKSTPLQRALPWIVGGAAAAGLGYLAYRRGWLPV